MIGSELNYYVQNTVKDSEGVFDTIEQGELGLENKPVGSFVFAKDVDSIQSIFVIHKLPGLQGIVIDKTFALLNSLIKSQLEGLKLIGRVVYDAEEAMETLKNKGDDFCLVVGGNMSNIVCYNKLSEQVRVKQVYSSSRPCLNLLVEINNFQKSMEEDLIL